MFVRLFTLALAILLEAVAPAISWGEVERKPSDWWKTAEARELGQNVLTWQGAHGSWPKNTETLTKKFEGDRKAIKGTFDNSATTRELRFLARLYTATNEEPLRAALLRGYEHILQAQYPNGGWPQHHPAPAGSYARHITFNDNAMVRLLEFLQESWTRPEYSFLGEELRGRARAAFNRGIKCIVRAQVRVDGKLTAWCAQHDALTLEPRPARTYELVSLSGAESAAIVKFLKTLESPSPEVRHAIAAAVKWFDEVKIEGIKVVLEKDDRSPNGRNKVIVKDPSARPMWARFYEIGTNRPIFVDRDGVKKYDLAEIGFERRNGYAWLGYWGEDLIGKK